MTDLARQEPALRITGLRKAFGAKVAVDGIDLLVPTGSFFGLVGPNGAGKTTTLSMATGLLRPDAGEVRVHGVDVWADPLTAKRMIGNLADGVRLFDRLTGEQLITYTAMMFGIPRPEIGARVADLLAMMDLGEAAGTIVADYSAGMTKKVALACALVHAPRLLVLDEPFESVDPVSAANIEDVLRGYTRSGGTVIVSSHSMDLVQRMCDHVAVIAAGRVLAAGTIDEVRAGESLQDRFVSLVGGRHTSEGSAVAATVLTLLRLRYRVLGNNLARRPWQLVGFCFGALSALGLLAAVAAAFALLSATQPRAVLASVAILAGSALILGWLVGPLLLAGVDTTVDAARLAPFPLRRSEVMAALTATGLTGIPGIVTTLAAASSVILWLRWPGAVAAAIPGIVLGVVTCVVATQLMSALSQSSGSRRGREITGTVVLVLLVLSGPIITAIVALLDRAGADLATRFADAAALLGWTPIGAAWSVPAAAASGAWGEATAKLAIAVAGLLLLLVLWWTILGVAERAPARPTVRTVRAGTLHVFGGLPTGGVGATWARSLSGWLRDPRYLRQLLVIPLLPVVFGFVAGVDSWPFVVSTLLAALVLSIAGYADVSYDGTAFASVLATGVRGRDDRLGRLLGAASVGVPLLIVLAVVTTVLAGATVWLPALLGVGLGVLLSGYGVSAVSSALIVTPVPAAGDSPFRSVPGQTLLNSLLVFVVWAAALVLATPSAVVAVIAVATEAPALGWVSLTVALVIGTGAMVLGVVVGGRTLDRTGPDLLARIRAFPV